MKNYQANKQTAFQYDLDLLKLINFNETSAKIYNSLNTKGLSPRQWAIDPSNPNKLTDREIETINIVDEINHKSGQSTFFRQRWLAKRLGVCKRTIKYWIRKFKCLGIIKIEKTLHHQKWINSYRVTEEFTKYKCAADGILGPCLNQEHSECVRPQVSYKCTSCHRFQAGLSIEQQHQRDIDTLKTSYETKNIELEQKISSLEQELAKTRAFRANKAQVKEERKVSQAKTREQFLSKLTPEQAAVIYSYEAVIGCKFNVEKDLRAFKQISQHSPITAIIGIIQTAINFLAIEEKAQGKIGAKDVNEAIKKASIYSLQYCVQQVERVVGDFRSAFNKVKGFIPSHTIMGYLGSAIGAFDAKTALELLGIIKTIPEKLLGGKSEIEYLLGIYASKMIARQVKAGEIEEEEKAEVFEEYFGSLLIEFKLRC